MWNSQKYFLQNTNSSKSDPFGPFSYFFSKILLEKLLYEGTPRESEVAEELGGGLELATYCYKKAKHTNEAPF